MGKKETNESLRSLVRKAQETGDWTPVEQADVSEVTDMYALFRGVKYADIDLSEWDTSNVINMHQMFSFSFVNHPSIGRLKRCLPEYIRYR